MREDRAYFANAREARVSDFVEEQLMRFLGRLVTFVKEKEAAAEKLSSIPAGVSFLVVMACLRALSQAWIRTIRSLQCGVHK